MASRSSVLVCLVIGANKVWYSNDLMNLSFKFCDFDIFQVEDVKKLGMNTEEG